MRLEAMLKRSRIFRQQPGFAVEVHVVAVVFHVQSGNLYRLGGAAVESRTKAA